MPPYLKPYRSITEGIIIFDVRLMVALGAIVLNERYRILDAELTEGNHDLCLRLQTWWAMAIVVSAEPWLYPCHCGGVNRILFHL